MSDTTFVIPHNRTVYIESKIHIIECANCSIDFGIGDDFMTRRRADGKGFYCPNGHSNVYNKGRSAEDRLRDSKAREVALNDQLRAALRDTEATRVQLVRDRQRIANGVCPCCNRYFDAVRRHIASEHPDYTAPDMRSRSVFECSCGRRFENFRGLRVHQGKSRPENWDNPNVGNYWSHLTVVSAS